MTPLAYKYILQGLGQQRVELRRQVALLARELADLLSQEASAGRQLGPAEDHGLGADEPGLEALADATPLDAKVLWMRPEYVALLGQREGVPWYFRWDARELARQVQATGTTHLVLSRYVKTDLTPRAGDPSPFRPEIQRFAPLAARPFAG